MSGAKVLCIVTPALVIYERSRTSALGRIERRMNKRATVMSKFHGACFFGSDGFTGSRTYPESSLGATL